MLHLETIDATTWQLVKRLMHLEVLNDFNLVGGTSLALQKGHRKSIDLDLFTIQEFNTESIKQVLNLEFENNIEWLFEKDASLSAQISGIKTDLIRHNYPILDYFKEDGIRMLSTMDIGAMKLNAVARRGSKKDFIDLFELLQEYSLEELLDFFRAKYAQTDTTYILRSLTFFDDAEKEVSPIIIKSYIWEDVKKQMLAIVKDYVKSG